MKITNAKYLTSAVKKEDILRDNVPEIAFVGRSNVGKSTIINSLCGQKNLAKASSTPGLTKMINYFSINDSFRFVDLPGYGYAKTSQQDKTLWSSLIEDYLLSSSSLRLVVVLIDIRREKSDLDKIMIEFLSRYNIAFSIVFTKCDKLSKMAAKLQKQRICADLHIRSDLAFLYSAKTSEGKKELTDYLEAVLSL